MLTCNFYFVYLITFTKNLVRSWLGVLIYVVATVVKTDNTQRALSLIIKNRIVTKTRTRIFSLEHDKWQRTEGLKIKDREIIMLIYLLFYFYCKYWLISRHGIRFDLNVISLKSIHCFYLHFTAYKPRLFKNIFLCFS